MKKIIAFSLWGNDPVYLQGAIENAKIAPFIYPGWTCRFYIDDSIRSETIEILLKYKAEIIDLSRFDLIKYFWRFLPISEKTIERFVVRDCDSRLNIREAMAVREWEASQYPFHIMRDDVCHSLSIQGGMRGAITFDENIQEDINKFLSTNQHKSLPYKDNYNVDQMFLNKILWPKIIDKHMAHSEIHKINGKELPLSVKLDNGM